MSDWHPYMRVMLPQESSSSNQRSTSSASAPQSSSETSQSKSSARNPPHAYSSVVPSPLANVTTANDTAANTATAKATTANATTANATTKQPKTKAEKEVEALKKMRTYLARPTAIGVWLHAVSDDHHQDLGRLDEAMTHLKEMKRFLSQGGIKRDLLERYDKCAVRDGRPTLQNLAAQDGCTNSLNVGKDTFEGWVPKTE